MVKQNESHKPVRSDYNKMHADFAKSWHKMYPGIMRYAHVAPYVLKLTPSSIH